MREIVTVAGVECVKVSAKPHSDTCGKCLFIERESSSEPCHECLGEPVAFYHYEALTLRDHVENSQNRDSQ